MKINIVIVLYQKAIQDSLTIQTLESLLQKKHYPEISRILLYDNGTAAQLNTALKDGRFSYYFSGQNDGLARAYNTAFRSAAQENAAWLLTLDDDTSLSERFLDQLIATLHSLRDPDIAAVAPIIQSRSLQISPVGRYFGPSSKKAVLAGVYSDEIMTINSAMCVSTRYLEAIGGYNEAFAVDFLDHWFCRRLFQEKRKIIILDTSLDHELSVLDPKTLGIPRFKSILSAEFLFYSEYAPEYFKAYRRHLIFRMAKIFLREQNLEKCALVFQYIKKSRKR